jgi:hypothetical protein
MEQMLPDLMKTKMENSANGCTLEALSIKPVLTELQRNPTLDTAQRYPDIEINPYYLLKKKFSVSNQLGFFNPADEH